MSVHACTAPVARMTAAVANGGKLLTPHVVRSITAPDGSVVKETKPARLGNEEIRRLLDERVA